MFTRTGQKVIEIQIPCPKTVSERLGCWLPQPVPIRLRRPPNYQTEKPSLRDFSVTNNSQSARSKGEQQQGPRYDRTGLGHNGQLVLAQV